jgi:hypothetical protein
MPEIEASRVATVPTAQKRAKAGGLQHTPASSNPLKNLSANTGAVCGRVMQKWKPRGDRSPFIPHPLPVKIVVHAADIYLVRHHGHERVAERRIAADANLGNRGGARLDASELQYTDGYEMAWLAWNLLGFHCQPPRMAPIAR